MPPSRHRSSGTRPGRQIDVRDLEQRDVRRCPCRRCAARRRSSPTASVVRSTRCCERERHRQLDRVRVGIGRLQRIGVRLVLARADEHVLDLAAQPLQVREPAEHRLASSAASPARPRAGSARPPRPRRCRGARRARARSASSPSSRPSTVEAEPPEPLALLGLGDLEPEHLVRVAGAVRDRPAARASSPRTSASPVQRAPASSTRSCDAYVAAGAGELGVDALLPARLALGAHVVALAASHARSAARSSPPRAATLVVVSDTSVFAAAHHAADRRSAARRRRSRDRRGSSLRSVPSSVSSSSPAARGGRRCDRPRACRSRRRAAGCRARASRSS